MVVTPGITYRPTGVAFRTSSNTVYVLEQFNHRISKWNYTDTNYDFTLDTTWGDKNPTDGTLGGPGPIGDGGETDGSLYRPTGIVFDASNGLLYVTDTFHNRVRIVDPTGNGGLGRFVKSIGQGGSGIDDFYHPAGVAVDGIGEFAIIVDELNHRAIRFGTPGDDLELPEILPDPSTGAFQSFVRPHSIVYDLAADQFNIGDSVRNVITTYTANPVSVDAQFGAPGTTGTNLFFPGSGYGTLAGNATTTFADTRNNILKTQVTSTIANTTGTTPGTGDGQLYHPESVISFVDAATNYVLAANTLNNRVESYSNTGAALTFQSNFGSP